MRTENISRSQLKAGRALARMDQKDVARAAGVSENTYSSLESGAGEQISAHASTLRRVIGALEAEGIRFVPGGAIRQIARGEQPTDDAALLPATA
jgi:transcriptional regulator with XRE-family HTH domain